MNISVFNPLFLIHLQLKKNYPGLLICGLISLSAGFISEHYGGPQLLYALLAGLTLHFTYQTKLIKPGVDFSAKTILRAGVALLGARITFSEISTIEPKMLAIVLAGVGATILFGLLLSKWLKLPSSYGLISAGSVGICGASAAIAIASVLPKSAENERFTLMVIVWVTILSTIAMIFYPFALQHLNVNSTQAGVFIGATIHDVAQVVAAGMLFGPEAGEMATVIKLLRITLLLPIAMLVSVFFSESLKATGSNKAYKLIPGFLLGFVLLSMIASMQLIPTEIATKIGNLSKWMLVLAISAAGVKTNFGEIVKLGITPAFLLIFETLFITVFVAVSMWFI